MELGPMVKTRQAYCVISLNKPEYYELSLRTQKGISTEVYSLL